tara:strand:+ start:2432 stop:2701 length:270 start_codon:yes stop_codon:yes gene_type:complete
VEIKVIYKKLGKEKVWGLADSEGVIYLDTRLKGKKHLEILIHEALHLLYPEAEEDEIVNKSISLCNLIWKQRYRRIEEDKKEPLQDGTL